ncbi:MAG TPA: hypothetical protein VJH55_04015 [Candidatus Paceibacterota bacterium]
MIETSIFLAKVLGLFSVISAIVVMFRYKKTIALEKEVVADEGLAMFAGYTILLLGILLVVSHQVWTADWRVVITIIGWLVILKGLGRILFPEAVKKLIEKKQSKPAFVTGEIALFCIGLYLLYYGFIVREYKNSSPRR